MFVGSFCNTIAWDEPWTLSDSTHNVLISTTSPWFKSTGDVISTPAAHCDPDPEEQFACMVMVPNISPPKVAVKRHEQTDAVPNPRAMVMKKTETELNGVSQSVVALVTAPFARGDGLGGTVPPDPFRGPKTGLAEANNGMAPTTTALMAKLEDLIIVISFLYLYRHWV